MNGIILNCVQLENFVLLIGGIASVILFTISVMDEDSLESLKEHIINKRLRYKVKNRTLNPKQVIKYLNDLFETTCASTYPNKDIIKNAEDLDYVLNTYLLYFKLNESESIEKYDLLINKLINKFNSDLDFFHKQNYYPGYQYNKDRLEIAKKYKELAKEN